MVKATHGELPHSNGSIDTVLWLELLTPRYTPEDIQLLEKSIALLQKHAPDSLSRGISTASILVELRLGVVALASGLVLESWQEKKISQASICEQLGAEVVKLLEGVKKMDAISTLHGSYTDRASNSLEQMDKLRKMLLAMAEDTRVILVKLADHLYILRLAKNFPADQKERIAKQTRDIYAPLANRLGIGKIKWEIEDLAFRYLESDAYKTIARLLDEKRLDRQDYIENVIAVLREALEEDGIEAEVNGRVKHIYSIWRKMQRKHLDYEEIYDVRALRVVVHKEQDCYAALGTVHRLWQHVPKEFDDYIATPKGNGYRSLHTAVIGPEGKTVEVQIRTVEMHLDSELGVAAHWRYKEGVVQQDKAHNKKIEWLKQLVDWQEEVVDAEDLIGELRTKVLEERVYILTPKGDVIDLPSGATPLDFAYSVHTDIGHRCRGAKVNSRMVPLTYELATGDQVEILTGKNPAPSRDWINPESGYLVSSRARAKVQAWFKKGNREENIRAGRALLDRESRRLALPIVDLDKIATKLNLLQGSDVLAALGGGDLRVAQIVNVVLEGAEKVSPVVPEASITHVAKKPEQGSSGSEVIVEGVGNLLSHIAGCCHPVPGDQIIGYITQNTGISIHRVDCNNVLGVERCKPERLVKVEWAQEAGKTYLVNVRIFAQDRPGLLRDITSVLTQERINITGMTSYNNPKEGTYSIHCTVQITGLPLLARMMEKIAAIPYVTDVVRES